MGAGDDFASIFAAMTTKPDPHDAPPRYQPLSRRRRLLLLGLAVATAVVVIWLMLRPQLRLMEAKRTQPAAHALPCGAQQTEGCIGGTMGVIVAPAAPGASR